MSECEDPEAPRVTWSGKNFQQTGRSTKSVHYTPDLSLCEAINRAERSLSGISLEDYSGSELSSSISLVNDTLDEDPVPLDYSTPNQSVDAEELATGLINDLVSDIESGEFTAELMDRTTQPVCKVGDTPNEVTGNDHQVPQPIEVNCVPPIVKSENKTESIEERASSVDTTNRFEGTPKWDSPDVPGWPTHG